MMLFCAVGQGEEGIPRVGREREGGGGSKQSEIACKIRSTVVCNNLAEWNKFKSLQTVTGMLHVLKFMENGSIEPFFPI